MTEQNNRIIIAGQLEFGSDRVYEQVVQQYEHRMENYYKNDILLTAEEIFHEEDRTMDIPRKVLPASDRQWLNTLNLLKRMSTFSIAGDLNLWRLQGGRMVEHHLLEPRGDRTSTQLYIRGRDLMDQEDTLAEAKVALTEAIEHFERHSIAYERRGFTNYQLRNYKDALYDYNKSIKISPSRPAPYYGRGLVNLMHEDNAKASIDDFEQVTKLAIPHQDIYWLARAMRGDALLKTGQAEEAFKEYRFFLNRKQDLVKLRKLDRRIADSVASAMAEEGKCKEALTYFEKALAAQDDEKAEPEGDIRYRFATCLKTLKDKRWEAEAKRAAELGNKDAESLFSLRGTAA
jgi:tetratricopeptide (TPR) repeat protein